MLEDPSGAHVLCNRGYDSDNFRDRIRKQKYTPVIPGRRNRTVQINYDKHLYKERNIIGVFFLDLINL